MPLLKISILHQGIKHKNEWITSNQLLLFKPKILKAIDYICEKRKCQTQMPFTSTWFDSGININPQPFTYRNEKYITQEISPIREPIINLDVQNPLA